MPFWKDWDVHWAADTSRSEYNWGLYWEAVDAGFIPEKIRKRVEERIQKAESKYRGTRLEGLAWDDVWVYINQWAEKWLRAEQKRGKGEV